MHRELKDQRNQQTHLHALQFSFCFFSFSSFSSIFTFILFPGYPWLPVQAFGAASSQRPLQDLSRVSEVVWRFHRQRTHTGIQQGMSSAVGQNKSGTGMILESVVWKSPREPCRSKQKRLEITWNLIRTKWPKDWS